jgi:yopX protein
MVGNGDIWIIDEDSVAGEWIVNNDIHLMQSTGLLDKNGKEIFEGDIVDYKGRKAVIKWHGSYASFIYIFVDELHKRVAGWSPLYLAYFHFEVIGNKFETPEFLEGKE